MNITQADYPSSQQLPANLTMDVSEHRRHLRIDWIDISRALAILFFIVFRIGTLFCNTQHAHVPPTLDPSVVSVDVFAINPIHFASAFISTFSLPLLFMAIGYTMRKTKISAAYFEELFGKYMIPYVIFGAVCAIVYGILIPEHDILAYLAALVYGNGDLRGEFVFDLPFGETSLPVLWLLPTLMLAQIFTFFLSKLPLISRIVIVGVMFLVGSASAGHTFLPFDIQPAICATWFMTCGMILREQQAYAAWGWEKVLFAICLTCGIGYTVLVTVGFTSPTYFFVANYPNGVIDMIGQVCIGGVFMLLSQVIALSKSKVRNLLAWLGENFLCLIICFGMVYTVMYCYRTEIVSLSDTLGTPVIFFGGAIIALIASVLLTVIVSKTPYVKLMFEHFIDGKEKSTLKL